MSTTSILEPLIDKFLSTMLSTLLSIFKEILPIFILYISSKVAFRFIKRLFTPKYDGIIFDDEYVNDFDLAYDNLRDMYNSDDDFINDYMSDFTAFQDDDLDYDGIIFDDDFANEFDLVYDSLRHMYDSDADFINDYMSDFTAFQDDGPSIDELFEEYSGDSYSDYVEHSETE